MWSSRTDPTCARQIWPAQIKRVGAFKARSGLAAARALQLDAEVVLGDVHFREVDVAGGT